MHAEIETWWRLQRLMTRYAAACDDRDWDAYVSVFAPDAVIDYTEAFGRAGTVDEIAPWMARIMDRGILPSTQHMLANLQFEASENLATGRVHYFNPDVIVENGERSGLFNGGVYHFEAVRMADDWKLSRLKARLLWSTRGALTEFEPPA